MCVLSACWLFISVREHGLAYDWFVMFNNQFVVEISEIGWKFDSLIEWNCFGCVYMH